MGVAASAGQGQIVYRTEASNFTSQVQDNNNGTGSFAGIYDSGPGSALGIYANGGNGAFSRNPQAVAFRPLTVNGALNGATLPLQVGQSFNIFVSLTGNQISGNSIGFALRNGNSNGSVSDYDANRRFVYEFKGGESSAHLYDSSDTQSGLPGFTAFQNGLSYTFTLVSSNEYNFSVGSGGSTYSVRTLGNSGPIDSFALYNRGYNNSNALFSTISVSNLETIGYTATTGETRTVTGSIGNNSTTGTNAVEKLGAGVVIFQANNTYSGNTTVSAGTLQIGNAGSTGTLGSGTTSITSGATLAFNRSTGLSVDSVINGAGSLTVTGAGPITLTRNNGFAGGTTIANGEVRANNVTNAGGSATGLGAVAIGSGGILGGSGEVHTGFNTLTVQNLGTITAGASDASIGTLKTDSETWNPGGSYRWKIASTTGNEITAAGSGWDTLTMSALNLSALSTSGKFNVKVTSLNGASGIFTPSTASRRFLIATINGAVSGFTNVNDLFILDTTGLVGGVPANGTFSLSLVAGHNGSGTSDLFVNYDATPEPTTALLFGLGAAGLLGTRRRRATDERHASIWAIGLRAFTFAR